VNLRNLRKQFGRVANVTRDRRSRTVQVTAGGLSYRADETRFANEAELVEHAKSKMPIVTVRPA